MKFWQICQVLFATGFALMAVGLFIFIAPGSPLDPIWRCSGRTIGLVGACLAYGVMILRPLVETVTEATSQ